VSDEESKRDARRAILSRRRRFLTIALASAGVATAACDKNPMVCLKVTPADDGGGPHVCLSAPMPEPVDAGAGGSDAGADATDAGAVAADDPDAGAGGGDAGTPPPPPPPVKPPPRVCLKYAPPTPCLTPKRPDKTKI
jgi:hypothetical protein